MSRLTGLVETGHLVGAVAGVRKAGRSAVASCGLSAVGGASIPEDAVFPLSSNSKPFGGVLAMRLAELGAVDLDAPVEEFLPELAAPRVLARPGGPLEDTVPAVREISLRHLLTMTAGFGWVTESGPLAEAMAEQGIAPGPWAPAMRSDEYLRRLGGLPLAGQPGEGWNYHNCSDVLGVLLERATGAGLAELLAEHVTGPLGLVDTGFTTDPARMPTTYGAGEDAAAGQGRRPLDTAARFSSPPAFASLACGLASTVADQLRFLDVLHGRDAVLSEESVRSICSDQLTTAQRFAAEGFVDPGAGYGFQVEVRPDGAVGWAGGLGTIAYANRRSGRSAAVFVTQSYDVPGTEEALEVIWDLLS